MTWCDVCEASGVVFSGDEAGVVYCTVVTRCLSLRTNA